MMWNTNPDTGIRYGVIALNSLDPYVIDDLWYGPDAVNVTEDEAGRYARADLEMEWDQLREDAEIAASETDPNMSDAEREDFVERWLNDNKGVPDRETYIEVCMQEFWDQCQIDEPTIEGTYEGVRYQISWLGGAPILWVFEGPLGFAERLCSPCVPGAADLDGGFKLDAEIPVDVDGYPMEDQEGYPCYCVPRDWLAKEHA